MKVNTYDLTVVFLDGSRKTYSDISRPALKYYRDWYTNTLFAVSVLVSSHKNTGDFK